MKEGISETIGLELESEKKDLKEAADVIFASFGEEVIGFRFLAGGNHNDNYLVETSAGKRVMRIEKGNMFHNLKKEFEVLTSLPLGLGPNVLAFDESHELIDTDCFVEEFIEGNHPQETSDETINGMADLFRKLHGVRRPISSVRRLSEELKPYRDNFDRYRRHLDLPQQEAVDSLLESANTVLAKADVLFANDTEETLLHNDTSRDNVIMSSDGLRLIDWEFAGYGTPETELNYFMRSFELDEQQRKKFLERYGFPDTSEARERLVSTELLSVCGDVGYSLWRLELIDKGEILDESSSERQERLATDIKLLSDLLNRFD